MKMSIADKKRRRKRGCPSGDSLDKNGLVWVSLPHHSYLDPSSSLVLFHCVLPLPNPVDTVLLAFVCFFQFPHGEARKQMNVFFAHWILSNENTLSWFPEGGRNCNVAKKWCFANIKKEKAFVGDSQVTFYCVKEFIDSQIIMEHEFVKNHHIKNG